MLKKLVHVVLSPVGRITRGQFWLAWILILILGWNLQQARQDTGSLVLGLAYLYLTITIYGKRLHDLGRSTWNLLWPYAIHAGLIGVTVMLANQALRNMDYNTMQFLGVLAVVPFIIWIGFALLIGLPQGMNGDNVFGADPRQQATIAPAPGQAAQ